MKDDFMNLENWKSMDEQGNYETALALLDSEMNSLWNAMQSLNEDDPEYKRLKALYERDEAVVDAIYKEVGYIPED